MQSFEGRMNKLEELKLKAHIAKCMGNIAEYEFKKAERERDIEHLEKCIQQQSDLIKDAESKLIGE